MASTLRTTLLATGFTLVGLALGLALTPRSGVDCERPPVAPRPDAERRLARLKAGCSPFSLSIPRSVKGGIELGKICLRVISYHIPDVRWIDIFNIGVPILPAACNKILSGF